MDAASARNRALLGVALAVPVVLLSLLVPGTASGLAQLLLAAVIQAYVGGAYYMTAWRALTRFRLTTDLLVVLGSSAAFGYGVYAFATGAGPHALQTPAVVLALIAVGTWMQGRATSAAQRSMRALLALRPASAYVVRPDGEQEAPVDQIAVGDIVVVRPGARLAIDGEVVSGASAVDESAVTGQQAPVEKGPGDGVIGGTMNLTGSFRVRVTRSGRDTVLGQMFETVEKAQSSRTRVHACAEVLAVLMIPLVIAGAIAALVSRGVTTGDWSAGIPSMIAVLIVACPSALGVTVPAVIMVGTSVGARRGILIRHPRVLEHSRRIHGVILDKTGTLTFGRPSVTDVRPVDPDFTEKDILRFAAAVEHHSDHPLARAVIDRAKADGIAFEPASDFRAETGGGVYGLARGHSLYVGRPRGVSARDAAHADLRDEGKTVIVVEVLEPVERRVGVIALADTLNPGAGPAVERLHGLGLPVMLLTGDNEVTARALAKQVRIDEVRAEVQSADKESVVREFQSRGKRLAMVGDGIGDAKAIAAATLGISTGDGAQIAREAGDIVLVSPDVRLVPASIRLCRAMSRRIRGGLFWALVYNAALLPLAALGFLHPMLAAAAVAASSVSVLVNALSLTWVSLDR